jgi:hypothetical protein
MYHIGARYGIPSLFPNQAVQVPAPQTAYFPNNGAKYGKEHGANAHPVLQAQNFSFDSSQQSFAVQQNPTHAFVNQHRLTPRSNNTQHMTIAFDP